MGRAAVNTCKRNVTGKIMEGTSFIYNVGYILLHKRDIRLRRFVILADKDMMTLFMTLVRLIGTCILTTARVILIRPYIEVQTLKAIFPLQ